MFTIIVVIVLCMVIMSFPVWVVNQESMLPTFRDGDIIIGRNIFCDYKAGDIVVCRIKNKELGPKIIKRVIAISGDIVIIKDNCIYVNGKLLEEDYLYEPMYTTDLELTVPENSVFVLGDNRNNSMDSRFFGCIPYSDVIGEVVFKLPF